MVEHGTWDQGSEGQQMDRKSLRKVTGKSADFSELAQDCVAYGILFLQNCCGTRASTARRP
jgi:hypothetical protein